MSISTHTFSLQSSTEVAGVIDAIKSVAKEHQLVHIASYMLNTVLVHNLTSELERHFKKPKIALIPYEKNRPTLVTLYTYDEDFDRQLRERDLRIEDVALHQMQMRSSDIELNLQNSKQEIVKRFFTDVLTGLPNIYQLRQDLEDVSTRTLVFFSFDNFKTINDFYGFIVGDFLLEKIAKTLTQNISDAKIYRITGSEFAILLHEHLDFYALKTYLTKLYTTFKHLNYTYHETVIYLDLSMASISSHTNDEIFSKVSMALQYAKENNLPFWIYEDRMNFEKSYESNLKASLNIRKAILTPNSVMPYFQPIRCNKTGAIVQYECLARLKDEEGHILSPEGFIPIAKKIKVYSEITRTIIDQSFALFLDSPYDFSINLSLDDLYSAEIYQFILDKLKTTGIGKRVIFELLESQNIQDFDKVARFVKEIKRYGARIAIDDFGSGYSNFSFIMMIDADHLKIDGSLIKHIDTDKNSRIVVETIVTFCQKIGIKTTAEYVHTSTIMDIVKSIGIDYSQGFIIDMPTPNNPNITL
ncbi:MAG: diguanylate cyclase [Sulfuricurvum sp. PC08-66]|nr:MAG: diguanylate cyclase [Sulfuricurvum sp. PC08-66]